MLTKEQVIKRLQESGNFIDEGKRIIFKVIDHSGNSIAPENVCYKISFSCAISNKRKMLAFWPNTVGFQGCSNMK